MQIVRVFTFYIHSRSVNPKHQPNKQHYPFFTISTQLEITLYFQFEQFLTQVTSTTSYLELTRSQAQDTNFLHYVKLRVIYI